MNESKDKFINDIVLWTPTHGHTNVSQRAKTYIHQLWMPSRRFTKRGDQLGWMVRESQRNPCCQHAVMMVMAQIQGRLKI